MILSNLYHFLEISSCCKVLVCVTIKLYILPNQQHRNIQNVHLSFVTKIFHPYGISYIYLFYFHKMNTKIYNRYLTALNALRHLGIIVKNFRGIHLIY